MEETDDSAAVHLMLLNELRLLEVRADALSELGAELEKKRALEDDAKLQYKALKEYLAARLKEFEKHRPAGVEDWVASTFTSALRKGHIEMRPPTNASPATQAWRNAVDGVREEMSWHAETLQRGLNCSTLPPARQ